MAVIRGQVRDAEGRPVDEVAVSIVDGPGFWPDIACLTFDGGRFDLTVNSDRAGRYVLGARSDNHPYVEVEVEVEVDLEVDIESSPTVVELTIVLVDPNGEP